MRTSVRLGDLIKLAFDIFVYTRKMGRLDVHTVSEDRPGMYVAPEEDLYAYRIIDLSRLVA